MTAPVFPGIAEFRAEPPMAGFEPLWQINGCLEDHDPADPESWGWLATISTGHGGYSGELALFLARAANRHDPLVAALKAAFCALDDLIHPIVRETDDGDSPAACMAVEARDAIDKVLTELGIEP